MSASPTAYLCRLGPVPVATQETFVYLRITEAGDVAAPAFSPSDQRGIEELLSTGADEALACEPQLADVGQAFGIGAATLPPTVTRARAAIAVFMAWGQRKIAGLGTQSALFLLEGATAFWDARPWRFWDDHQALQISFTGLFDRAYEGSIFGTATASYGLALYHERGALQRLLELQISGELEKASALPAIAVTLDDKPGYAVDALRAAELVPRLPVPLKTSGEGLGLPTQEEVWALTAALRACSMISPERREVAGELSLPAGKLIARVSAPPVQLRS